jgi:uncharacterized protein (DUF924 family)
MTTHSASGQNTPVTPGHLSDVLEFWFGTLDESGGSDEKHRHRWFKKSPAFDEQILSQFAWLHATLLAQGHKTFRFDSSKETLAAIIVLDQFSRNMYRETAGMFASDEVALGYALDLIALGEDKKLPRAMRTFAYMPLMHSERLLVQNRCIALFQEMAAELTGSAKKAVEFNVSFAIKHREIIEKFGRFPHRNQVLGRTSTEAETTFLEQPGSSF